MQVYSRIMSPYMPQGTSAQTNAPTPMYAPGELGCAFYDPDTGNTCLRVKLDSGATAANTVGVVAAGQLAFWKDQVAGIVTNDKTSVTSDPLARSIESPVSSSLRLPLAAASTAPTATRSSTSAISSSSPRASVFKQPAHWSRAQACWQTPAPIRPTRFPRLRSLLPRSRRS